MIYLTIYGVVTIVLVFCGSFFIDLEKSGGSNDLAGWIAISLFWPILVLVAVMTLIIIAPGQLYISKRNKTRNKT